MACSSGPPKKKVKLLSNQEMDGLDICDVCMDAYEGDIRPRCLPCGHNFCENCLKSFFTKGKLMCAQCKKYHNCTNVKDFPINYALEGMIAQFKKAIGCAAARSLAAESRQEKASELAKNTLTLSDQPSTSDTKCSKMKLFIQENAQKVIQESKDMKYNLHLYRALLKEMKVKHEAILPQLKNLVKQNEEAIEKIEYEYEELLRTLCEGEPLEIGVTRNLETLNNEGDAESNGLSINEMDTSLVVLEKWLSECGKVFPKPETLCFSQRTLRASECALTVFNEVDEQAPESIPEVFATSNIIDNCRMILDLELHLIDVQLPNESHLKLMKSGCIYAIQGREGITRSARITVQNNQPYLHCLTDKTPPISAHFIQQSALLTCLNKKSILAFIDLSWGGSVQGRIHILLSPNTPLAKQFRILCTGELGHSYLHSTFLMVHGRSNAENEFVFGGDYEGRHGKGGAALITDLKINDNIYNRKFKSGCVRAQCDVKGRQAAQFIIVTGSGNNGNWSNVFGQVQSGLDVVKRAITENADISKVIIADCGVLLPIRLEAFT